MRLLADESVDFGIVRALRQADYDVVAVVETGPGISDREVAARAYEDSRVLLTEDKDFGQLVYATGTLAHGVIFIRYPAKMRAEMIRAVLEVVDKFGDRIVGSFTVVHPRKVRFSRLRE